MMSVIQRELDLPLIFYNARFWSHETNCTTDRHIQPDHSVLRKIIKCNYNLLLFIYLHTIIALMTRIA